MAVWTGLPISKDVVASDTPCHQIAVDRTLASAIAPAISESVVYCIRSPLPGLPLWFSSHNLNMMYFSI